MALIIPTIQNPYYSLRIKLGGEDYELTLKWNTRTSSWYCKVATSLGYEIIAFERLASRQPIILYNKDKFVKGNIYVLPTTLADNSLGFNNLGVDKNFSLVYLTEDEINEFFGGLL